MLVSMAAYGGGALLMAQKGPPQWEQYSVFVYVLGAIAVTEPLVIVLLRRMLFFTPLEAGEFEDEDDVIGAYWTTSIVTWALAESIAIYGLVVTVLTRLVELFFPFAAIGVGLLVVFRYDIDSQLERFEQVVENQVEGHDAEEW